MIDGRFPGSGFFGKIGLMRCFKRLGRETRGVCGSTRALTSTLGARQYLGLRSGVRSYSSVIIRPSEGRGTPRSAGNKRASWLLIQKRAEERARGTNAATSAGGGKGMEGV
jgi:hypothetical protein